MFKKLIVISILFLCNIALPSGIYGSDNTPYLLGTGKIQIP